jgi:hypothetical protein
VDIAKDPSHSCIGATLLGGHDLKSSGIRARKHVRLLDASKTLDRRSIETDTLVERFLELFRGHREALQKAENVREPKPYQPYASLLDRPEDVFLLAFHGARDYARFVSGRLRWTTKGSFPKD